ncbi:HlyD family type I secretion periplasmic adaptor subunit [Massilia sp. TWP1-3-3]|uniref:HlyD family type I secretion periplasmic adaptor subunit n=1 Tax=Massilia sp. TWP1-3-3 TaxID=2804573 RepID=UPI003CF51492
MSGAPHPLRALLARYRSVLGAAWDERAALAGPARLADELAFLPAAISLQETPPHPAPRRLAWCLMGLFVLALAWSIIGQVDIVAVAPGRIIVSDRTKLIQPLEASVVRRVLVKDGQHVQAGQLLVELDPTAASADQASVAEQRSAALSEQQRSAALLRALADGRRTDAGDNAQHAAQLQSEWLDISARLARLDADSDHRQAEMNTVQAGVAKLEATVPLAQSRESDFKQLVGQGYMSGHATQDKTRERIELERDLATQRARLIEARSALQESVQAKAAYRAEAVRSLSDREAQAKSRYQQLDAEHSKASQRKQLTHLSAPVAGVIQQLAIHTAGGVVTPAQELMIVVPDSAQVSAQVSVANQDIGFVHAGQMVDVKLETFPYTRYGTVRARVDVVTSDAVTDDKHGAFYPATLTFAQKDMLIDGKRVALAPGMNITAEIKTGRRRIIDFLLSPVQKAGGESLRER